MSIALQPSNLHTKKQLVIGSFCVLVSAVLFAIKAILIKYAYGLDAQVDAVLLLALRMASALPFFMVMAILSKPPRQKVTFKQWGLLCVAGIVGYYLASILDFMGLMYVTASLERVILFLYPTLTLLMSAALQRRKISLFTWFAVILSYGGTLMVMLGDAGISHRSAGLLLGSGLIFASAVAYALYLLMTPSLIKTFGSLRLTGLVMSVSSVICICHYLVMTPHPIALLEQLHSSVWLAGLALGVFSTVLPATLLMQGIVRVGPSQAALLSACGPIITVLLAVIFLQEHLSAIQWLGCILNIVGVLLITLTPHKTEPVTIPHTEDIDPLQVAYNDD